MGFNVALLSQIAAIANAGTQVAMAAAPLGNAHCMSPISFKTQKKEGPGIAAPLRLLPVETRLT